MLNSIFEMVFKKKLSALSTYSQLSIYIFYLIILGIVSFIFCELYILKFPNIIDVNDNIVFRAIPFHHGEMLQNLYDHFDYTQEYKGVKFYLMKLPVLPFLILFLSKISLNFYFIVISKNIILYSAIFFTLWFVYKKNNLNLLIFVITLIILFYNPYNLIVGLNFVYEDSILVHLVPLLFFLTVFNTKYQYWLIAATLFFIILTKSSMFFLAVLFSFIFFILEKGNNFKKIIPFFGVILAIILWGTFGYLKTGKFPVGSSMSTMNSYIMAYQCNDEFANYYPYKSIDPIGTKIHIYPPKHVKTEWEFYDFYKKVCFQYMQNNKKQLIKNLFTKLNFIYFGIQKDGQHPDEKGDFDTSLRYSNIPNKIILNLSILFALYSIFYRTLLAKDKLNQVKNDIYFLSILVLFLLPYLIGWAVSKHLVPAFLLCHFYALFKIFGLLKFNKILYRSS